MEDTISPVAEAVADDATSQPFVGRWNLLVSTTNWEKGRIIHEWREALIADDADRSLYADDVWSRTVGNVTPQHVGRLRRVFERFGDVCDQYAGLFWSHFQAALDWDDAEMWLEGGVQNNWSVADMRRQRWEALGADESLKPRDEDIIVAELNEDAGNLDNNTRLDERGKQTPDMIAAGVADVADVPADKAAEADEHATSAAKETGAASEKVTPVRPFETLPELPDDVADAFESMKLAILRHKAAGWQDIARDDLLLALDSLKELALAASLE